MRLKLSKTWSQQQLAVKLRVTPSEKREILTWERRRLLIHAAKTACAAALCWWLARQFGLHDGYWGAISAIIVLQSNFGATVSASRDRIFGTLIGAALGFSFSFVGALPWNYILAVLSAVILCGLLALRNSSRLAGVTITIVMLVQNTGSRWSLALDRVTEVLFGIVAAILISTLIFPDRARLRLRDGLAQEFLVLSAFFEGIIEGFGATPPVNLPSLRKNAMSLLQSNNQFLEAARNEPAGSPGSREGLGMLAQFGRSIMDALVALEYSVKGSREDDFAQQLEPALSQLALDIRTGFHHVAGCIHNWKFNVQPAAMSLEADIEALETRMAEIRHTGVQYSQDEILRAYSVQLHLKQIARLLRAARVETSEAVGEGHQTASCDV